jgi:hypothetical protein
LELIQKWSDFMKTSSKWNYRDIVGKIMMGLVLAVMIGSMDVAPAIGHERTRNYDNNRYEHRGRGYNRDRYVHDRHARRYNDGYRERVYVPPRIYAPPPPPGIGIFFPPIYLPFGPVPGPRHR